MTRRPVTLNGEHASATKQTGRDKVMASSWIRALSLLIFIMATCIASFGGCGAEEANERAKRNLLNKPEDPINPQEIDPTRPVRRQFLEEHGGEIEQGRSREGSNTLTELTMRTEIPAIDTSKLPGDARELERVILLRHSEIAQLLGPHAWEGEVTQGLRDLTTGKFVQITEGSQVRQSANGDFYMLNKNNQGSGWELYAIGDKIYDRLVGGHFTGSSTRTGKHTFFEEKSTHAVGRFYKYFRGHLKFTPVGETLYEGREAYKVIVERDPDGKSEAENLPLRTRTRNAYRLNLKYMDRVLNRMRARIVRTENISGELLIDKLTGVVLKADLKGTFFTPKAVPEDDSAREDKPANQEPPRISFTFHVRHQYSGIGVPQEIKAPRTSGPAQRRRPPSGLFDFMGDALREKAGMGQQEEDQEDPPEQGEPAQESSSQDQD